jgi:hypothetical protein
MLVVRSRYGTLAKERGARPAPQPATS